MMRTSFDLSPSVLIIDADAHLLESYTAVLDDEFQVYTATTGEEGLACLQRESIGLVIAAMASPPWHGRSPVTPVETVVPLAFGEVVGQSTPMQQLATLLSRVADTDATVLITGESGVGKELVARALHQ